MTEDAATAGRLRPLHGADAFTRVLDHDLRRSGHAGFHSYAVLRLDERPDVAALRAALAAGTPLARGLRTPLRRRFLVGRPVRDLGRPMDPPRVDVLDAPPPGEDPWPDLLNARLDPRRGENVRFTVFPVPDDGWRVAYLFHHLLMDAKGAERVLARLTTGAAEATWPAARTLVGDAGFRDVADRARKHADWLEERTARRLHVAARAADGRGTTFQGEALHFDADATAAAVSAGRKAAGYAMEGLWYLACLLAADRETDPRPADPDARYAVPLPTSLDRKGEERRTFGNHLVFLFLTVPVEEALDPATTARRFRGDVLDMLRDRRDRASEAQMEFCKRLPPTLYSWMARRSMGGAFGSLFFTNPGVVAPGLERFFGARVTRLSHYPVPTAVPGLCGTVWTHDGCLALSVTWLRGRVADERARALLRRWGERVVEAPA